MNTNVSSDKTTFSCIKNVCRVPVLVGVVVVVGGYGRNGERLERVVRTLIEVFVVILIILYFFKEKIYINKY